MKKSGPFQRLSSILDRISTFEGKSGATLYACDTGDTSFKVKECKSLEQCVDVYTKMAAATEDLEEESAPEEMIKDGYWPEDFEPYAFDHKDGTMHLWDGLKWSDTTKKVPQ